MGFACRISTRLASPKTSDQISWSKPWMLRLLYFFHGVVQRDFAPRNVLHGNIRSTDLQVVIFDFSASVVTRLGYSLDPRNFNKLPPSPIKRWSSVFPDFGEWVPPTREKFNEWLWKHWQASPLHRPVGYGGRDVEAG